MPGRPSVAELPSPESDVNLRMALGIDEERPKPSLPAVLFSVVVRRLDITTTMVVFAVVLSVGAVLSVTQALRGEIRGQSRHS